MNKKYKTIDVNGFNVQFANIIYDADNNKLLYGIASTRTRQVMDYVISNLQSYSRLRIEGNTPTTTGIEVEDVTLTTYGVDYVAKIARCKDENTSDGVHAIISANNDNNILKVYDKNNASSILYSWLIKNTEVGILEEWQDYIFEEFLKRNYMSKAVCIDYTGKAPDLYIIRSSDINRDLTNVKVKGLKYGNIKLTEEYKELPESASFVEIVEQYVLPNIDEVEPLFKPGNPVSEYFGKPINKKNNKFYDGQIVMGQGLLEAIKADTDFLILRGGTGVGKSAISLRTVLATFKEYFKSGNGRALFLVPPHIIGKWKREAEDNFTCAGEKVTIKELKTLSDIDNISKKPKGYEILFFTRDKAKRTYLVENLVCHRFNATMKYAPEISKDIYDGIAQAKKLDEETERIRDNVRINPPSDFTNSNSRIIENQILIKEVSSRRGMNYINFRLTNSNKDKLVLVVSKFIEDGEEGYYVKTLAKGFEKYIKFEKTYGVNNYKFYGDEFRLKAAVKYLYEKREITMGDYYYHERNRSEEEQFMNFKHSLTCPCCGLPVYKGLNRYLTDEWENYKTEKTERVSSSNAKCSNPLRADGTPLSDREISLIRSGSVAFEFTEKTTKDFYLDEDGNKISKDVFYSTIHENKNIIVLKKCNGPHIGAKDAKGYRTVSLGKYFLKRLGKKSVDITVCDEVHEYLAPDSLQATLHGQVCKLGKKNIIMTGTLTSGKASDLFYLFYRLNPAKMLKEGFKYNDVKSFVAEFGRFKRDTITYEANISKSNQKVIQKDWEEIPGISPNFYNVFLVSTMISRNLQDLNVKLPEVFYINKEVEPEEELKSAYNSYLSQFISFIGSNFGVPVNMLMNHSLMSYLDNPNQEDDYLNYKGERLYVATPPHINLEGRLLNKEKALLEVLESELAIGRRVVVYVSYTGAKQVQRRVEKIIKEAGFKVAVMDNVPTAKREKWLDDMYDKGVEVIVCNPIAVSTGMDILNYPTLYYYELPTSTHILRQSQARTVRINSVHNSKIYFSYYKDTIQHSLTLIQAEKKKASVAIEGFFEEDCFSSLSGSKTVEELLNDALMGRIKLNNDALNAFDFKTEEEINQSINNSSEEESNIVDVNYEEVISLQEIEDNIEFNGSIEEDNNIQDDLFNMFEKTNTEKVEEKVTKVETKVSNNENKLNKNENTNLNEMFDLKEFFIITEKDLANKKKKKEVKNAVAGQLGFVF